MVSCREHVENDESCNAAQVWPCWGESCWRIKRVNEADEINLEHYLHLRIPCSVSSYVPPRCRSLMIWLIQKFTGALNSTNLLSNIAASRAKHYCCAEVTSRDADHGREFQSQAVTGTSSFSFPLQATIYSLLHWARAMFKVGEEIS